ncbi:MAG: DEAD/DEAH box helicase [Acidimicrobiales bacterium]
MFKLREDLIGSYRQYATSFLSIKDQRILDHVSEAFDAGRLWPPPMIGLNPSFQPGGTIDELVGEGILHPQCSQIFRVDKDGQDLLGRPMTLHQHQTDAIHAAAAGENYVLTTGTGSGKSLSYIVPIVDHVLRTGSGNGVKAIVVYPMNALANSQLEELSKFLDHGPWGRKRPVTFARYTGQDDRDARDELLRQPPDIILTNYVMLELILTRYTDRRLVRSLGDLRFLVLDELHTYRGRQGADVSLLVRRLREAAGSPDLLCVGTSATMSSEGGYDERQAKVADVASTIFGSTVSPGRVIGETLIRATNEQSPDDPAFAAALSERVAAGGPPPTDHASLVADPLSSWIESTFGLVEEDDRLVRAVPRSIEGEGGAAKDLSQLTGQDPGRCAQAIREQLLAGYDTPDERGFPSFAFRLHQFLSRGDTVHASPETPAERYLSLTRQRFVPGSLRSKVLLPLAFCRECGQEYYVVRSTPGPAGSVLSPRDIGDAVDDDAGRAGFVYISSSQPWPDSQDDANDRLPAEWFDDQGKLRSNRRDDVPKQIEITPAGEVGDGGTVAWWVPTPFRFCLSCGVSYAGRLGRDFGRLSTLGSDGRSTATTIMSLAAVQHLRRSADLPAKAKKLLSFTDNRQDASLQAGHFNDFVQVTLLRAALYNAALAAGPEGLRHDELAQKVFDALALPFEDYASEPELKGFARTDTDRALQGVLAYRVYRDLERGWRLTQPNLEQTGLLEIEYESLTELAADEDEWRQAHPALAEATRETREFVLRVLLDTIRRELAVKVEAMEAEEQERIKSRSNQRLAGPWAVAEEMLRPAPVVTPRSSGGKKAQDTYYVSSRSGYGQFLRRASALGSFGRLTLQDTDEIIVQLFEALRHYGLLAALGEPGPEGEYQLPAAAMRWVAGDGTTPYQDHIRMPNASPDRRVNEFFVDLYTSVGDTLQKVEAREHTAQVPYEERLDREERFRSAELPVLYCSPTMELGVDISQLNVVNMRNVPPTPANYAQRSGRAGRSGQPALVFTYCAAGNSHDQHYFKHPEQMVSGQVEAPRLDLANEDLLRAHIHAVWLAESGLDLGKSMTDVLDLGQDVDVPPLFPNVLGYLGDDATRSRAKARAEAVIADMGDRLAEARWWHEGWLDETLDEVAKQFQTALDRWRALYKAALQQAREQSKIKQSASTSASDKRMADRLRREAENQLDLLRAESDNRNQSDFYTYRYFAAEGFLPGYSFPRLPLSAFIPGRRSRGSDPEFLQRPRFLAISEFGPQSLVYHEGARYRINRVILPVEDLAIDDGGIATQQAKQCDSCGYLHPLTGSVHPDMCVRCGVELPPPLQNLFRLQNVSTVRRDRITSDEEERQRKGYEIISGVHFAERDGELSVSEATVSDSDGNALLHLAYGDTATIWRVNLGWRRRRTKEQLGFVLDIQRGYWSNANDAEAEDNDDPMSNQTKRVIPYVEDSRNVLLIQPIVDLSTEQMASLQAALKVAFQVVFQLEDDEVAAEPLPGVDSRNLLLFYESAEGGAGALRRLIEEPALWHRVAAEAMLRCHIDPVTETELKTLSGEDCEAACYDCLLSYRNQTEHQLLDRHAALPLLRRLRSAQLVGTAAAKPKEDGHVESALDQEFLDFLRAGGFKLPDKHQAEVDQASATVDFLYVDQRAAVFIDGPHHVPDEADAAVDERLRALGLTVIRFGHQADWPQRVDSFARVFGGGNQQ